MGIVSKIRQVRPKQEKSVKSAPISEGGLGLSPRTSGSKEDDIKKAQENKLAKYWYDKYEELVKEVKDKFNGTVIKETDEEYVEKQIKKAVQSLGAKNKNKVLYQLKNGNITIDNLDACLSKIEVMKSA